VITCPKCGKENQDHYKFCLGCGAELPRETAPKPFAPQTPPHGMRPQAVPARAEPAVPLAAPIAQVLAAPVVAAPAPIVTTAQPPNVAPASAAASGGAGGAVICPQCSHENGTGNLFCGSCGFRLGGAPVPSASFPPGQAQGGRPGIGAVEAGGNVVLTALRADGTEAGTYRLPPGTQVIGRETGSIFAGDSYLSPRHATFRQPATGRLLVKDDDSLNGVYKKLTRDIPVEVKPNAVFRIGQEIIRFEPLAPEPDSPDGVERLGAPSKGYVGRIALIIGREATGNAFPLPESGVQLGRERGDVLFPEDGYVSGLHGRLTFEEGRLLLTDLGSSNGSFIRLGEETELKSGDVLLMGQQLFRIAM
jgi:pSer/pThr/pTyr-binding forkhead associated (FHA) protein